MGLSTAGDQVTVEPLPFIPSYLQSIDIEAGFAKRGHEVAEQFSGDDMAHIFIRAYNGLILTVGQPLAFEYHGQSLKLMVKGLSIVDLADNQKRRGPTVTESGVLMDKTDVTFMKAADSSIKIKSSAKKCVCGMRE